jgi:hypothetical protein
VTTGADDAHMNTADRTGLLIVRLWIEGNAFDGFRARITQKLDSAVSEHTVAMAGNSEDVCAAVQRWIDAFVNAN